MAPSVAAIAAVVSYACEFVHARGKSGWTALLVPLTVDGLI
jgi:hypothetical protein